jgi:hypothetical protein
MYTLFKLIPEAKEFDFDVVAVNRSLPSSMQMEERSDGIYVVVDTPVEEDEVAQQHVQRELDRIFFLTCVRARAEMCRRTVCADFKFSYRIHGTLPADLEPQNWSPILALQLRLWDVAADIVDPPTQLLIFYQIIELSYPKPADYPAYTDASSAPHPRTEAKLLRHLVSHAGHPTQPQTQKYLQFLGLGPVMANRSDPAWLQVISEKVKHVRQEAYVVINSVISTGQYH